MRGGSGVSGQKSDRRGAAGSGDVAGLCSRAPKPGAFSTVGRSRPPVSVLFCS